MKRKNLLALVLAGTLTLALAAPALADGPQEPYDPEQESDTEQWVDPETWVAPEGWAPEAWTGPIIWTEDLSGQEGFTADPGLPPEAAPDPGDAVEDPFKGTVDSTPDPGVVQENVSGGAVPEAPVQPAEPWYAEAMWYVMERGIMTGSGDSFDPDGVVTRAMAFQALWKLEGMPAEKDLAPFTDVPRDCWYQDSASWAQEAGITQGDGMGRYNGQWTISRCELAAAFCRYAQFKGLDVSVADDTLFLAYSDALTVPDYAADTFLWAVDRGVINGKAQDWVMVLDPNGTATRAELASMFMRLSRLLSGEG